MDVLKKCGNIIGANETCPLCATAQHNLDPFTTLGDVNYGGSLECMEAISLLNAENLPAGAIYTESNFVITDNK